MSLFPTPQKEPPFKVVFSTNQHAARGMVQGVDPAWSIEEAKALALVRVQHSGIPGTAYVWEGEKCIYKVWKDFDNRLFHVDNPEVAR